VDITGLGQLALTVQRSSSPVVGKFRIFDIAQNKIVTISDLTIANGWAFIDVGGGVHNSGTLSLVNVIVDGNIADQTGGGVYNESGATLGVCNSSIYLNSAGSGGGIFNLGSATIECSSQIYSNAARDLGGGIYNDTSATMTITDSAQIYGNSATYGGGIFNKGTLSMDGGAISANSASKNGGGIYDEAGTATFSNLKINRNDAQKGGGLYAEGGTTTLDTCTVGGPNPGDHNTASVLGPGGSWPAGSTAPNLINCIINDAFDPDPNP